MRKSRTILSTVLFLVFFLILPPQFAQNVPPAPANPDQEIRSQAIGLIRIINTAEVSELNSYGSFAAWQTLSAHQAEYINQCTQDNGIKLGQMPEIFSGWSLRLNVGADGKGYDLVLRDLNNKQDSYAAYSNEEGVIWEAKPLQ